LITVLGLLGPRAGVIIWWLIEPARWSHAFHGFFLWPVLGFLFLPWTTLAWVLVAPHGSFSGIGGFGWFLLVIALLVDLGSWSGGGYGNRRRLGRPAPAR